MALADSPIWGDISQTFLFPDSSLWPVESAPPAQAVIVEPPPGGYPPSIVHPERPDAPFFLISPGWYRSPNNEVVSYRVVAEYVLTAQNTPREELLRRLGQSGSSNILIYAAVGVGALILITLLAGR